MTLTGHCKWFLTDLNILNKARRAGVNERLSSDISVTGRVRLKSPDSSEFTTEFGQRRISDLWLESTSPWSRHDIAELSDRWLEIIGFCIGDYHGNGWREVYYEIMNSDTSIVHVGFITLKTSEQRGYMFWYHSWSWEVNRRGKIICQGNTIVGNRTFQTEMMI